MTSNRHHRWKGDRRGVVSLEVGLIALPLSMLLFGTIEFGLAMRNRASLQYLTEQAARCAAVTPGICGTSAQVQAYAATRMNGITLPANTFSLATAACGKQVTASMPYSGVTTTLLPAALILTGRSCYPL